MKDRGINHLVVRVDGNLRVNHVGKVIGYFTIIKHLGFNYVNEAVYLVRDIFGEEFPHGCITKPNVGNQFVIEKSVLKNLKLSGCYTNIIRRCYDSECPQYKNYMGKGITVCEDWLGEKGRENFKRWAASTGYDIQLTIDRTDANKGYSPDNCTWMSRKENGRKTSRAILSVEKAQDIRTRFKELSEKDHKPTFFKEVSIQFGLSENYIKNLCYDKRSWN